MRTIYLQKSQTPGYGDRLYVPYKHTDMAYDVLNKYSCWSGADKDTGLCKSWEFSNRRPERLIHAIQTLRDRGFVIVPLTAQISNEVWP
jgi:hypothetical protein